MATAWRGALDINGFPVNIRLFGRVKSRSGESFKTLDPKHKQPIRSAYLDVNDNEVPRDQCLKGVKNGDTFVALTDKQVELIGEGERSGLLEPEQWVPLSTLDLSLAVGSYTVTPDGDVAGSDRSANLVWNGLRDTGLAYISRLTMRSGARDSIVAFYADDDGMYAVTLPFEAELNDVPSFDFKVDAKQAEMFRAAVVANVEVTPFDHDALESEYRARRDKVIEAALKGKKLPVAAKPKLKKADADLMAMLETQVAEKKPAKKPAAKKAAARRKAA